MYLDYYQGYCVTVPLTDQDIIIIQESKDLSYETSGKLGSKGGLVDLNFLKKDGGKYVKGHGRLLLVRAVSEKHIII